LEIGKVESRNGETEKKLERGRGTGKGKGA